jgi:hypothetical protein
MLQATQKLALNIRAYGSEPQFKPYCQFCSLCDPMETSVSSCDSIRWASVTLSDSKEMSLNNLKLYCSPSNMYICMSPPNCHPHSPMLSSHHGLLESTSAKRGRGLTVLFEGPCTIVFTKKVTIIFCNYFHLDSHIYWGEIDSHYHK